MKELNFPIVKITPSKKKILSMDKYLEFVEFNLKHNFDRKAYKKWKKMLIVDKPFSLGQKQRSKGIAH